LTTRDRCGAVFFIKDDEHQPLGVALSQLMTRTAALKGVKPKRVVAMSLKSGSPTKPDWLPDWTDSKNYSNAAKTSSRAWAWEFLRRNAEYQKLWQLEALPNNKKNLSGLQLMEHSENIMKRLEWDFGLRTGASPSMKSSAPDFEKRLLFVTHGKRWAKPVDWPDDVDPYVVNELLEDPSEVILQFDVRWPLKSQIVAAETFLKEHVEQLKEKNKLDPTNHRMIPKYFREYLRLLDAEAAGEEPKKMSKVIYNIIDEYPDHKGQQKVFDSLKRARWLRDKGYRFIAIQT